MEAFIKGISVISPPVAAENNNLQALQPGFGYLKCVEPQYREFIDPMASRRMSRIVKMGVYCARKCIKETGIDMPDGIIAGTGLGCLEDTGKFLDSIYANDEKLLNPTPFIQSTHNTIAGAIALAIKCHGYNATYTQRAFSFENALSDAMLQLAENPSMNILTGGFDEVTETSFELTSRLGLWKNHPVDIHRLYEYNTRGSIAGEGVVFMMLGGKQDITGAVCIKSLSYVFDQGSDINGTVLDMLNQKGIDLGKTDLVILGYNGDSRSDHYYHQLVKGALKHKAVTAYKHLCGEYDTSTSFALWLAWHILKNGMPVLPAFTEEKLPQEIRSVLIYNQIRGKYHSVYYLQKC